MSGASRLERGASRPRRAGLWGHVLGDRIRWAAALGLTLACSSTPGERASAPDAPAKATPAPAAAPEPERAPPVATPTVADEAAAVVALAESLAAIYREHAGSCPALAAALEGHAGAKGAPLRDASPAVLTHLDGDEALRGRLRQAMEAVMTGSIACEADPAYLAVLARVRGG